MIKILLSPQVPLGEVEKLTIGRQGSVLIVNDEELDLSFMGVGDTLQPGAIDHPLLARSEISKTEEGITVMGLIFNLSPKQTDPAACFPEPVVLSEDGPATLPPQSPPEPEPLPEPETEKEVEDDQD